MEVSSIPTVDLSPFLKEGDDDDGNKKKAMDLITQACSEGGFFIVLNHGVPLHLMHRAMELSKAFFGQSREEKLKSSPRPGAPLRAGYGTQLTDEYFLMFSPGSTSNVFPTNPPEFQTIVEDIFGKLSQISELLESIFNDCLGLPSNYLKDYNDDRSWDSMIALHFQPSSSQAVVHDYAIKPHEDASFFSLVLQDDIGGLEVEKNGEWIPVTPTDGTLIVKVGDAMQVLTNEKFKSVTHRIIRPKGQSGRLSYAFHRYIQGNKWIEPLSQFTKATREPPKYRGFFYKEHFAARMINSNYPLPRIDTTNLKK